MNVILGKSINENAVSKKTTAFRVLALLFACALAMLLCSCAATSPKAGGPTQVVVDSVGREVEVPLDPINVAALDSFTGEAMVMIGAGDRLCGAPAGVISDALLCEMCPSLAEVSVPLSGGTFSVETLTESAPDVVFIKSSLYYARGEAEKLEKMGIPYLVVSYATMEGQMDAIAMIGRVCGGDAEGRAEQLNQYYRGTIETVEEHAATIPESERKRVYHAINEVVRTDGEQSLGTDWIECVGAVNVSSEEQVAQGETDYNASLEQIFLWDPDIVICNAAGTVDYLYSDSKWEGLRAVREERVYAIPVGATRWGQRGSVETFFAMLWLGTTLYPQHYDDIDLQAEVTDFYREYLGIEVDDALYETMLSGEEIRSSGRNAGELSDVA